jgi:hypothetical protein
MLRAVDSLCPAFLWPKADSSEQIQTAFIGVDDWGLDDHNIDAFVTMWVGYLNFQLNRAQIDVFSLLSMNVGPLSVNAVPQHPLFSIIVGRNMPCFQSRAPMLSGHYT